MSIYMDHNATTVISEQVLNAMNDVLRCGPCNASAVHKDGKRAKNILESSRKLVKGALTADDRWTLVFTSCGTEANNMIISGCDTKHKFVSTIEHKSVLESVGDALISVTSDGIVDLEVLDALLYSVDGETALVSVMCANNETGVIQPIAEIAKICSKYNNVIFHTDASQIVGKLPFNADECGADVITISGHKFGAPLGVGALLYKNGVNIRPLIYGGGQEYRMRSGTHNLPAIYGMAIACSEINQRVKDNKDFVVDLRLQLEDEIRSVCGDAIIGQHVGRLPNTSSIILRGVDSRAQVIYFDNNGISVSAGSACSSGTVHIPYVHMSMGIPEEDANCALRVSLASSNTKAEVEKFVQLWRNLYTQRHTIKEAMNG